MLFRSDTSHRVVQHIVGVAQPLKHAVVFINFFQLLVEDNDQRIDMLAEFFQTLIRNVHAFLALVAEWLGHHCHRQGAELLGHLSNDRCGTGTRTTTHAGSDKHHVRTTQRIFDAIAAFNRDGVSVLLVEQNAHAALGLASRGYVMESGRITLEGAARALAEDPRVVEAYLGG